MHPVSSHGTSSSGSPIPSSQFKLIYNPPRPTQPAPLLIPSSTTQTARSIHSPLLSPRPPPPPLASPQRRNLRHHLLILLQMPPLLLLTLRRQPTRPCPAQVRLLLLTARQRIHQRTPLLHRRQHRYRLTPWCQARPAIPFTSRSRPRRRMCGRHVIPRCGRGCGGRE